MESCEVKGRFLSDKGPILIHCQEKGIHNTHYFVESKYETTVQHKNVFENK